MIADARAYDAPPCDSLAEAVVIDYLTLHPEMIGTVDLGPLLVFPEHRALWQALVRAHMRMPDACNPVLSDPGPPNYAEFILLWRAELQQSHPNDWLRLIELLGHQSDLESHRAAEDAEACRGDFLAQFHAFEWWLERLRAIHEARLGIQAAQRIAEGFWRVPEHEFTAGDARDVLRRFCPVQDRDYGVEVPV